MIDVIYRGPLERARLAFLVDAVHRALGPVKVWWLAPVALDRALVAHAADFFDGQPAVADYELLDGRYAAIVSARSRLAAALASTDPMVVIGEDAMDFVHRARSSAVIWCVNGVPEERALHASARDKVLVRAEWAVRRLGRAPALTVTVSEPMSAHLADRIRIGEALAVPCCVDRETYREVVPAADRGPVVAYMGSGARWQAIDETAAIWAEAARRRPDLQFLVVSRDQRCDALLAGVGDRGHRIGVSEPAQVAAALQEARVGMLVRLDHVVNRVAFPTKLGEYVGCGLSVLATDLAWDVSRYVADTGCGALVPPDAPVRDHVDALLALVDQDGDERSKAAAAAADLLARTRWVDVLADAVARATGREAR